jgi:hypothetical protein
LFDGVARGKLCQLLLGWPGRVSIGTGAVRTTFSATLPRRYRSSPDRPWVPITKRSTIDGLENPDASDSVESYSQAQLVQTRPHTDSDDYLKDIVVSPHQIGNSQKSLVSLERTRNAEIGPFRVIGSAGADYTIGDASDHNGELVYLGMAPGNLGSEWHPQEKYDRTRNVHVHTSTPALTIRTGNSST